MNYQQAEKLFFSWIPAPRTHAKNSGLIRTKRLLSLLQNPEYQIPHYIHVTGTSGKGSVCAYLQSILSVSGQKTGLYVSPHPTFLTERWSVNGKTMSPKDFIRIITKLETILLHYQKKYPSDPPTFLELCTVIALYYFAEQKVDWAVIEVGAGGEFDPTNIIPHKDVAIITNIGLDHIKLLGNTKEKIAHAKSGIITPGATVFTAEKNKKLRDILHKKCRSVGVVLKKIPVPKNIYTNKTDTSFSFKNKKYRTAAVGVKQAENAALAIAVARQVSVTEKHIREGLWQVVQPLRFEIVHKSPLIILDGAHNEDKMKSTVTTLQTLLQQKKSTRGKLHLVVGFSADKKYKKMLAKLLALRPTSIACTRTTVNPYRIAVDPTQLAQLAQKKIPHITVHISATPADAVAWSRTQAKSNDTILITGSIFVSGEVRPFFI